jgi:hypothetical protein
MPASGAKPCPIVTTGATSIRASSWRSASCSQNIRRAERSVSSHAGLAIRWQRQQVLAAWIAAESFGDPKLLRFQEFVYRHTILDARLDEKSRPVAPQGSGKPAQDTEFHALGVDFDKIDARAVE